MGCCCLQVLGVPASVKIAQMSQTQIIQQSQMQLQSERIPEKTNTLVYQENMLLAPRQYQTEIKQQKGPLKLPAIEIYTSVGREKADQTVSTSMRNSFLSSQPFPKKNSITQIPKMPPIPPKKPQPLPQPISRVIKSNQIILQQWHIPDSEQQKPQGLYFIKLPPYDISQSQQQPQPSVPSHPAQPIILNKKAPLKSNPKQTICQQISEEIEKREKWKGQVVDLFDLDMYSLEALNWFMTIEQSKQTLTQHLQKFKDTKTEDKKEQVENLRREMKSLSDKDLAGLENIKSSMKQS